MSNGNIPKTTKQVGLSAAGQEAAAGLLAPAPAPTAAPRFARQVPQAPAFRFTQSPLSGYGGAQPQYQSAMMAPQSTSQLVQAYSPFSGAGQQQADFSQAYGGPSFAAPPPITGDPYGGGGMVDPNEGLHEAGYPWHAPEAYGYNSATEAEIAALDYDDYLDEYERKRLQDMANELSGQRKHDEQGNRPGGYYTREEAKARVAPKGWTWDQEADQYVKTGEGAPGAPSVGGYSQGEGEGPTGPPGVGSEYQGSYQDNEGVQVDIFGNELSYKQDDPSLVQPQVDQYYQDFDNKMSTIELQQSASERFLNQMMASSGMSNPMAVGIEMNKLSAHWTEQMNQAQSQLTASVEAETQRAGFQQRAYDDDYWDNIYAEGGVLDNWKGNYETWGEQHDSGDNQHYLDWVQQQLSTWHQMGLSIAYINNLLNASQSVWNEYQSGKALEAGVGKESDAFKNAQAYTRKEEEANMYGYPPPMV